MLNEELINKKNLYKLDMCKDNENNEYFLQYKYKENLKKIFENIESKDNEKKLIDFYIKKIISFEDCCNDLIFYAMKYKYYELFNKCIECNNIKFSDRYFFYENYNIITNPYYIERFEKKGKYFTKIKIDSFFNYFIKFINGNEDLIDENIRYYINKKVNLHAYSFQFININIMLKLLQYGYTNINYKKLFLYKIKVDNIEFINKLIEKVNNSNLLSLIIDKLNKSYENKCVIFEQDKLYYLEIFNNEKYTFEYKKDYFNNIYNINLNHVKTLIELKEKFLTEITKIFNKELNILKNTIKKCKKIIEDTNYKKN